MIVPKLETRHFLGQVLKKHKVRKFEIFALTIPTSVLTREDIEKKEEKRGMEMRVRRTP